MKENDNNVERYFEGLEKELKRAYTVSSEARKRGIDPELEPEIPLARDLAERVEGLAGPPNIAGRIRELDEELSREDTAIKIAGEIVDGKFGSFGTKEEAAEQAIRTSLAILTEGVVAAPLEGLVRVAIKKNYDGSRYLAIYFAGPIRSAGGSDQALVVLTGDYIRRGMGLGGYKATDDEVERFAEEVDLYNAEAARLQYFPTPKEVRNAIRNIPVEITGEGTERIEVSGYRDLERIETNQLRGGAVLVLAEGVLQKIPKILKHVKKLRLDGWEWLNGAKDVEKKDDEEEENQIKPSSKFIKDLIAGRPVLAHPSAKGGLRLRYGRARNSGLASVSLHPATMAILDSFIAVGTQIKTERPGKGAAVTPCDSIEGPIVKLLDGSVVRVEDPDKVNEVKDKVKEILFLGDILISYGDFLENNHVLLPSCYCEEWWVQELERAVEGRGNDYAKFLDPKLIPTQEEAITLSEELAIPLHPRYTYFYHDLTKAQLKSLVEWLCTGGVKEGALTLEKAKEREILGILGVPFMVRGDSVYIEEYKALLRTLGISNLSIEDFSKVYEKKERPMDIVNSFDILVREKSPTYIGARMGRPEKAKERKMSPPVNVLFPIGQNGGRTRDLAKAAQKGNISVEVARRACPKCGKITIKTLCSVCGGKTELRRTCMRCKREIDRELCVCGSPTRYFEERNISLGEIFGEAVGKVGRADNVVKGVIGMTSKLKIPEPLEKGILRAKHDIFVFKDGTTRFDSTDVPLTHFRPGEVGVAIDKLKELGYEKDFNGKPLENEDQVVELKVQDIIMSEEGAVYLLRVTKFIDELLEKVYGLATFYNADDKGDLIGHLVLGLAPHTSAAVLGRIVGFTRGSVGYAHPYFHAAKRRNCDGDEDAVLVLLDALLNFSAAYLPSSRGGRMDEPLVLTTRIDPKEVDEEVQNIDVVDRYPLEFYEKSMKYAKPQELQNTIETIRKRIGRQEQYFGIRFTHDTSDISSGPKNSAYKTLGSMMEKVKHQLSLAGKLRAVDEADVARRIVESHFLPDLAGNLRTFSKQKVRCVKCNQKYRRVPLMGKCRRCGGKLVLTVSRGSVEKYLKVTQNLIQEYNLNDYLKQRTQILEMGIASVFDNQGEKQVSLADFL